MDNAFDGLHTTGVSKLVISQEPTLSKYCVRRNRCFLRASEKVIWTAKGNKLHKTYIGDN